jgi:anti-anti-sigma factor
VQFLSSQAIGIILTMNKKLMPLKSSKLVLCGVGPKLMELLKITRLDRLLTIKPTQREALKVVD